MDCRFGQYVPLPRAFCAIGYRTWVARMSAPPRCRALHDLRGLGLHQAVDAHRTWRRERSAGGWRVERRNRARQTKAGASASDCLNLRNLSGPTRLRRLCWRFPGVALLGYGSSERTKRWDDDLAGPSQLGRNLQNVYPPASLFQSARFCACRRNLLHVAPLAPQCGSAPIPRPGSVWSRATGPDLPACK
jgi:hypothetical protein